MRVLVIGATGTIGSKVAAALSRRHEVIGASRHSADHPVDITDRDSIRELYDRVGTVDAMVSCAGGAAFAPLAELGDDGWELSFRSKLMGQIDLVRMGLERVKQSFTITTGILANQPTPGSAAVTTVNAALEGFVRAAALELDGRRINAVSPGWVSETLAAMGRDPAGGTPAEDVARVYVETVEGAATGVIY